MNLPLRLQKTCCVLNVVGFHVNLPLKIASGHDVRLGCHINLQERNVLGITTVATKKPNKRAELGQMEAQNIKYACHT